MLGTRPSFRQPTTLTPPLLSIIWPQPRVRLLARLFQLDNKHCGSKAQSTYHLLHVLRVELAVFDTMNH